jgi:TetR/AcrR family transcriptional regulator, transcriptional repressor for nem operon
MARPRSTGRRDAPRDPVEARSASQGRDAEVASATPVHPARTARGEASRTRILNSAIRLMWRDGYDGVSLDTILSEAGVLKGSFYHYFTSKVELLLICLDHLWSIQRQHLKVSKGAANTGRAELSAHLAWLCEAQLTAHRKYGYVPGLFHMSVGASAVYKDPRLAEKFKQFSEEHQQILRSSLEKMFLEEGLTADAYFLSDVIGNYISGTILHARISNDISPILEMSAGVMKLLRHFEKH